MGAAAVREEDDEALEERRDVHEFVFGARAGCTIRVIGRKDPETAAAGLDVPGVFVLQIVNSRELARVPAGLVDVLALGISGSQPRQTARNATGASQFTTGRQHPDARDEQVKFAG